MRLRHTGVLPITDPRMTRFSITLEQAMEMVFHAMGNSLGGEIFVPKIPSYRITDLAEAIGPGCRHEVVGIRPGEKIHEEMIVPADSVSTVDIGNYYAILPMVRGVTVEHYLKQRPGSPVEPDFHYHSGNSDHFLGVDELRDLIRKHIDPKFAV
jgi:FlaA1/EpsC-like NDP-sugar epimerase